MNCYYEKDKLPLFIRFIKLYFGKLYYILDVFQ